MTAQGSTPKKENPFDVRKVIAGVLVTVIGGILLKVSTDVIERLAEDEPQAVTEMVIAAGTWPVVVATTPAPRGSPTPKPRVFDFEACPIPCDGSNALGVFPEDTKVIYSRWNYANVPAGARYLRAWSVDGMEWVRYDCVWQGAPAGMDEVELREPMGFHSGEWKVTIAINDLIVLEQELNVEGNNTYWDPAGVFHTCYGE